jgi:TP901 family phage tail tape measure protein
MSSKLKPVVLRVEGDSSSLDGALKSASTGLSNFGKSALKMLAGVAIAKYAKDAASALYSVGREFEDASVIIRANTGKTGAELEKLENSFQSVATGVSNDMQSTATAVAELNTRLGLTGKPLEQVSTKMLDLSRIFKKDINVLVPATTRMFGDWGISNSQVSESLDQLVRASQASGAQIDTLAQSVVNFGAPLRNLGFTLEQSIALFAKFEKEGVNIEAVMSGLRMAVSYFGKEGIVASDGLKDLIETIKTSDEVTGKLAAKQVVGQRAFNDFYDAVRGGKFDLQEFVDIIENGSDSLDKLAQDTETTANKIDASINRLKSTVKPAADAVTDITAGAIDLLNLHLQAAMESGGNALLQMQINYARNMEELQRKSTQIIVSNIKAMTDAIYEKSDLYKAVRAAMEKTIQKQIEEAAAEKATNEQRMKAAELIEKTNESLKYYNAELVLATDGSLRLAKATDDFLDSVKEVENVPEHYKKLRDEIGNVIVATEKKLRDYGKSVEDAVKPDDIQEQEQLIDKIEATGGAADVAAMYIDGFGKELDEATPSARELAEQLLVNVRRLQDLSYAFEDMGSMIYGAADAFEALGIKGVDALLKIARQVDQVSAGFAQLAAGLANGSLMQQISGGLGIFSGVAGFIGGLFSGPSNEERSAGGAKEAGKLWGILWSQGAESAFKSYPVSPNGKFDVYSAMRSPDVLSQIAKGVNFWNQEINDKFGTEIGHGINITANKLGISQKEAFSLYIPILQELIDKSQEMGFQISGSLQGLIDHATNLGYVFKYDVKDAINDVIDANDDLNDSIDNANQRLRGRTGSQLTEQRNTWLPQIQKDWQSLQLLINNGTITTAHAWRLMSDEWGSAIDEWIRKAEIMGIKIPPIFENIKAGGVSAIVETRAEIDRLRAELNALPVRTPLQQFQEMRRRQQAYASARSAFVQSSGLENDEALAIFNDLKSSTDKLAEGGFTQAEIKSLIKKTGGDEAQLKLLETLLNEAQTKQDIIAAQNMRKDIKEEIRQNKLKLGTLNTKTGGVRDSIGITNTKAERSNQISGEIKTQHSYSGYAARES